MLKCKMSYLGVRRFRHLVKIAIAGALLVAAVLVPDGVFASGSYTYDLVGRLTTAIYDNGTCVAYS